MISNNSVMSNTIHLTLDTTGLLCPEPLMLLHKAVRDVDSGQIIQVLATDPSTERDIPKFCTFLGHTLVLQDKQGEKYTYLIQKA